LTLGIAEEVNMFRFRDLMIDVFPENRDGFLFGGTGECGSLSPGCACTGDDEEEESPKPPSHAPCGGQSGPPPPGGPCKGHYVDPAVANLALLRQELQQALQNVP
jgi:hypothetical protein